MHIIYLCYIYFDCGFADFGRFVLSTTLSFLPTNTRPQMANQYKMEMMMDQMD